MKYYSITQAASMIGIARRNLYVSWIYKGRIRVKRMAGKPMICAEEIDRIRDLRGPKAGDGYE